MNKENKNCFELKIHGLFTKAISKLIAVFVFSALFPLSIIAEENASGKFSYETLRYICTLNGENLKTLVEFRIPDGYTIIAENAFYGCSKLKKITIPNGILSIENKAFSYCESLENITIPSSVKSLAIGIFYECRNLSHINIDAGNLKYSSEDGILFNKTKSTLLLCPEGFSGNYVIPEGVSSIGDQAFYNCRNLKNVTIPNSLISIGHQAFYNCEKLIEAVIPYSVMSIGEKAFCRCENLKQINIPGSVISISKGSFLGCKNLEKLTIQDGVKIIENEAFKGCSSLEVVLIPKSIERIGAWVFSGCKNLESVTMEAYDPPNISVGVFDYNVLGFKIHVPPTSLCAYKTSFSWYDYANYIDPLN